MAGNIYRDSHQDVVPFRIIHGIVKFAGITPVTHGGKIGNRIDNPGLKARKNICCTPSSSTAMAEVTHLLDPPGFPDQRQVSYFRWILSNFRIFKNRFQMNVLNFISLLAFISLAILTATTKIRLTIYRITRIPEPESSRGIATLTCGGLE